jgi:glycosyltransferase involved in cell wall biosynthesis
VASPLVTVGMPVTRAVFFEEALRSALIQTWRNFEVVVVNDGPDRGIREIVGRHPDPRVRYFEYDGRVSIIENWNRCVERAAGEYFVLFSDDDVYGERFLEHLVALTARYPEVDVFHGRLRFIDRDGRLVKNHATAPEWETCLSFLWHRVRLLRHHTGQEFLCRTSALRGIGGFVDFPLAWNTDIATWATLARWGGIAYAPGAVCNFRMSNVSLSVVGDVFRHYEADCAFARWLTEFVDTLEPSDAVERELLADLRGAADEIVSASRLQILMSGRRGSPGDVARVIARWVRYGRAYDIPFRHCIRATVRAVASLYPAR